MPSIIELLNEKIETMHLLKHPFYVAWGAGELSLEDLRHYSRQYFAHVSAFPTYLSEMHCRCTDLKSRQIIAANLADEEATSPTHPELWLDFAAGLGVDRESVLCAEVGSAMNDLIDTYRSVAGMDTGLAAAGLYCYEKQIPAVAGAKIAGLEANYGLTDPTTLRYFRVHESADVEHAAQWESMLNASAPDPSEAAKVADEVLSALWKSLDEIYQGCGCAASKN
jgi:pyrroloquinoline-quinone synthase